MKLKLLAVFAALTTGSFAALSEPEIRITAVAMPNGVADAAALQNVRDLKPGYSQYVSIVPFRASAVKSVEFACEFEFLHPDTGVPVNVQNCTVRANVPGENGQPNSGAMYASYQNDVAIQAADYENHGKWNPVGGVTPDLLAFTVSGPAEPSNKVANFNLVPGSVFSNLHKVQVLRQKFSLDSEPLYLPLMAEVDDSVAMERFWRISFDYDGVHYERELNMNKTYAEVRVVPGFSGISNEVLETEGLGPYSVEVQVSFGLDEWYNVPRLLLDVPSPYPATYPKTTEEFEAWFARSKALPGIFPGNLNKRFYRLKVGKL